MPYICGTNRETTVTLSEFKAWFEGFTESMDAAPSKKQWERIKARVAEINGVAVTREVIYRDHYWPYVNPYPPRYFVGSTAQSSPTLTVASNTVALNGSNAAFNAGCALVDLGKAEYQAVQ